MAQQNRNSSQGNNAAWQGELILRAEEQHSKDEYIHGVEIFHSRRETVHRATIRYHKGKQCSFFVVWHSKDGEEIWHRKREIIHIATIV